jgi:peroxiredoxin
MIHIGATNLMKRRSLALLSAILVWALLTNLSAPTVCAQEGERSTSPVAGQKAPDFKVRALDGTTISLSEYRDKVVLISFWATWCGNCLVELPWLAELRDRYAANGFEVIGVLTDNAPIDRLHSLLERDKVRFPIAMCNHATAQAYGGLPYLPALFFVDRKGALVKLSSDVSSEAALERGIREALGLTRNNPLHSERHP